MFDFFEGLIENLELKLINNFTDEVVKFINNVFKNTKASSGYGTNQASSGYGTQQASSGNYTNQASSGNYTKQASSGYGTQQASSGDYTQQASSGYGTKQASSGNYTQQEISGKNSVSFACGVQSIVKAKKGNWIALCEWKKEEKENNWIPIFAQSAQIGNKEYKDFKGRILKETEYYCLHNKEFYPIDLSDGVKIMKISEKKRENITIIKGLSFDNEEVYLVKEKDLSAHGETLKEAIDDLTFKKLENTNTEEIIKEIKETGKVTRAQYRAITGACQFGTEQFCKQHNIEDLEEIELDELRKILVNDYGAEKFWSLIDDKGEKICER